jgi:hypothetical protein
VKFFKNADAYGLPLLPRSRQGYVCVDGMTLKTRCAGRADHIKASERVKSSPFFMP